MDMKTMKSLVLLLSLTFIFGLVHASPDTDDGINVIEYYGTGCPHCLRVAQTLEELQSEYDLNIEQKEIYFNANNRQEMFNAYIQFGLDPNQGGVPTMVVENRSIIIGEVSKDRFRGIFDEHISNATVGGVFTEHSFSPIEEKDITTSLTLATLLGAALVDSINPCTITVMVLLLGVILMSEGKKKMAIAATTFIVVIFIAYLLMGLGILTAITSTGLTNIFYYVVTVAALLLSVMEFNAYFKYKPGFFAVEIPMFLRPYVKNVMKGATSVPGVAFAALLCSLFLLPCSSGPYLMVLSMIAKSVTLRALLYLVIYNIVFVLPMAAIALVVYMGRTSVEEIGDMREKYIKQIHLLSGIILFCLFILMIYQILHVSVG
jgi:cytochrome c biogenesis protein CcdA/glutaredoxin